jgi:hypothetical protein
MRLARLMSRRALPKGCVPSHLAAGLLTAIFVGFGVLVPARLAFADPGSRLNWLLNAVSPGLGPPGVVADSLAERRDVG